MKYMLDTNICIYIIKKKPEKVINKLKKCKISDIVISSITLSELEYGVFKSSNIEKNKLALTEFLAPIDILPYDDMAASVYGEIRAFLEKQGKIIGAMDLLIAAHAISTDLVLISNNIKEFKRVPGIKLENWM